MTNSEMSRIAILEKLRAVELPPADHPMADGMLMGAIEYPDVIAQFIENAELVGATVHRVGLDEVADSWTDICKGFEAGPVANVAIPAVEDQDLTEDSPHSAASLVVFGTSGEVAVAENGAIWVSDTMLKHRVALCLTQHLVLVVSADCIVNNMHEAYQRLENVRASYGTFISGPSKTADIEQSLVIGAHGARTLDIIVVDD